MLKVNNTALIVIDVQGKLARIMHDENLYIKQLAILIKGARLLNLPILWMEQLPDKLGPTIPEIREQMSGLEPIVKNVFSCCGHPEFNTKIQSLGVKNIILSGIEAHICVYQTAMDLLQQGYHVEVVEDATSARFPTNKAIGLEKIKQAGGSLTTVEMVLFEIMGKATGDAFKEIINLIK